MGSLSRSQLAQAERHITRYGQGRNPISLLMELGQLLHISPDFEIFEPEQSTVHLHVFKCVVRFGSCIAEAEGYSKKLVKTAAAKNMTEELLKLARQPQTTVKPTQRPPYTVSQHTTSAPVADSNHSIDIIGNAVGKLQEHCVQKRLGIPDYTFQEELLAGNGRKFIATVTIPGLPSVKAESINTKAEAKKLAAHKMYSEMTSEPGKSAAMGTVRSRIRSNMLQEKEEDESQKALSGDENIAVDTLRSRIKGMKLLVEEELTASPPTGKSQIVRVLKTVNLDTKCREALALGEDYSAVEKLRMISESGNFDVDFHIETSPDGESHMCLVEAKIGVDLVCHGIASSQPEAEEIAAGNMLSLIGFFSK